LSRFHSIPTELPQLSNLRALAIENNHLAGLSIGDARIATLFKPHVAPSCLGSIPAEIGQLLRLEELFLGGGQLVGL
jgi:hypothetical protein